MDIRELLIKRYANAEKCYELKGYNEKIGLDLYVSSIKNETFMTQEYTSHIFEGDQYKGWWGLFMYMFCILQRNGYNATDAFAEALAQAPMIYAEYRWNKSKVMYAFDKELEDDLMESKLTAVESVPVEALKRIPHKAFFIHTTKGMIDDALEKRVGELVWTPERHVNKHGVGFMVTFSPRYIYDNGLKQEGEILDIVAISKDDKENHMTVSVSMEITEQKTIGECMKTVVPYRFNWQDYSEKKEFEQVAVAYDSYILLNALQYVLYLCAENSEVRRRETKRAGIGASRAKKALAKIAVMDVGAPTKRSFPSITTVGNHSSNHTGVTVRPHVRRSHWAHRWVGGLKGTANARLELRWIRETYIHADETNAGTNISVKNI